MHLYKISADGIHKWAGSQSEAAAARKAFTEAGVSRKDITTVEVEVPTKKAELLDWLNSYVCSYQL